MQVLNEITLPYKKQVPPESSCEFGIGVTLGDALKKPSRRLSDDLSRAFPSKDCAAKLAFWLVVRGNGPSGHPCTMFTNTGKLLV